MKRQWKDYQIIILMGIIAVGLIGLCDGSVPNCAHQFNGAMYPNTLDCSTFWVCEYERPTLVQCDKGLLYDPEIKVCNWWYAVDCGDTPVGPTTEEPTTSVETTTDTTTQKPVITTTEEVTTLNPETSPILTTPEPDTTRVPETTQAPEPETTKSTEPPTTEVPIPESTTIQIPDTTEAVKPETTEVPAPETTEAPVAETTTIKEPTTVVVSESETQTPEPETTQVPETTEVPITYPDCEHANGQTYYPHLTDPRKYYICAGVFPVELQCPPKFVWSQEYTNCISTEVSEEKCSQGEYIPHPDDEQYYYQCIDDNLVLSLCPSNLKWNQDLEQCAEEAAVKPLYPNCNNTNDQIYFPHLIDTAKYYFCAGIYPVELPCPFKFQWNQGYERCIRTEIDESEEELIDCLTNKYACHPANDQTYFECVDNIPIIEVCPSDLKWSQELLDCIKENPDEPQYPQCNNPTGQIYFPHLTDSIKYYICAGDFAIELSCPTEFLWVQDHQSCAKTNIPVEEIEVIDCSSENGPQSAPYESDDHFYYLCIGEKPALMLCPSDFKWDNILKMCTDEVTPEPIYPQCINPTGQIYFPHLTDPSKYYICAGEYPVELPCPVKFLWSQQHESCVRTETPESEEQILECDIENGTGFAQYPEDDQLYYQCVDSKPILMLCPSDLKWNQELFKCANHLPAPKYPDCENLSGQIYFPHLDDSAKYYICAGNFPIELSCPIRFLWVQEYQSCGKTESSEEEITVIDCSLEDGPSSAPHEDEQYYYLCVAEKPILMLCPSDLKWDNTLKNCISEITPEPVYPQCDNPNGQKYFPHLTEPRNYYICAGDLAIELPCPSGFLWNQNHQSCARTEPPSEEEKVIDCTLENGPQSAPYEEEDQLYYLCIDEQPILMLCPSDLKWDQHLKICTETTTIDPEYPQCANSGGQIYFKHLTNVNKYYICAGVIPIELSCPINFVWNQEYESCVADETSNEEYPLVCEITDNTKHMSHPTDSQKYFICMGRRPALLHCPSNAKWNDNVGKCMAEIEIEPSYPPCGNGQIFFPHLSEQNQYYLCSGDYPLLMTCPNGYIWSTIVNSCVENVVDTDEPDCSNAAGKINLPHPTDPNKYYICLGTTPLEMNCPAETIWDTTLDSCAAVDTRPIYPDCGNEQTLFPHLTDDDKYYMCIEGVSSLMTCNDDYIWDTKVNACVSTPIDDPEPICTEMGTFLPHPTDVTKYYACIGSPPIPFLFTCTPNTFWISAFQRCDSPDMANLPNLPTISFPKPDCSKGEEFLTNYQDCHKYYICIGGIMAMEFTCEKDTYWDPINARCINENSKCFLK